MKSHCHNNHNNEIGRFYQEMLVLPPKRSSIDIFVKAPINFREWDVNINDTLVSAKNRFTASSLGL